MTMVIKLPKKAFSYATIKNAIYVIRPYVRYGIWMFDDQHKAIYSEPFVGGMDIMIDELTEKFGQEAYNGFNLYFSMMPVPLEGVWHLKKMAEEKGGAWYRSVNPRMGGWLCPVTLQYYDHFPEELFVWADLGGEDAPNTNHTM
jgi:hypothetical protein